MNRPLFKDGQRVFYKFSVEDRPKQMGYGCVVGIRPLQDAYLYAVERNDGEGCPWLTAEQLEAP